MSIARKVNGECKTFANRSVVDHSQLSGTEGYGCHPISAIRKLPEKLTALKNADSDLATRVSLVENSLETLNGSTVTQSQITELQGSIESVENKAKLIDVSVSGDTVTFSNYDTNTTSFRIGNDVDNDTIALTNNAISLKKVYASSNTFSGLGTEASPLVLSIDDNTIKIRNNALYVNGLYDSVADQTLTAANIKEKNGLQDTALSNLSDALSGRIDAVNLKDTAQDSQILALQNSVNGMGGYLTTNNFGSATPSQSDLNTYAIQQIGTISQASDIPDQTKVKNSFDSHVWNYNNRTGLTTGWIDIGTSNVVTATTDTLGVIKSSTSEWEGAVDVLGHLTINGLEEKYTLLNSTVQNIKDLQSETVTVSNLFSKINQLVEAGHTIVSLRAEDSISLECSGVATEISSEGTTFDGSSTHSFTLPLGMLYSLRCDEDDLVNGFIFDASINALHCYGDSDSANLQSGICNLILNIRAASISYDVVMNGNFSTSIKTIACKSGATYTNNSSAAFTINYL